MRSTLFYIHHADPFFNIPVFGIGWALALLIVIGVVLLLIHFRRPEGKQEVLSELPLFLLLAAGIVWGAPLVEERTAAGIPVGIPIRGYGMMMLLGVVSSVLLLIRESRRMGLHPDLMLSLAFWMIVTGFAGARVFYVIEYWPQFSAPSWGATLGNIAKLTDGGLVVYGSFIGASITVLLFVRHYRLPLLAIADLLGPCLMLGLAFGRIGCLLNGCCWGGHCDQSSLGVTFPPGSPPYVDQIKDGSLLDMQFKLQPDGSHLVQQVQKDGRGDRAGLKAGDVIQQIRFPDQAAFNRMRHGEDAREALLSITLTDGRRVSWEFGQLPERTTPVYPTQIFSSINAALICLFLWAYYPFRRHDGEVAALLVSIYPVTRILLEMIRTDESGLFAIGFKMTISQTISTLLLIGVVALWFYILSRPRGSALPLTIQKPLPARQANESV